MENILSKLKGLKQEAERLSKNCELASSEIWFKGYIEGLEVAIEEIEESVECTSSGN